MSNTIRHPKCHMRTVLGNCDPIGGFCTSVNESICEALHKVSRPQGEWIRDRYWSRGVGMGEEYGFFYKCSLCEYEVENGYTRCGFNFCPYCGAKMDGERKESE